MVPQEALEVTLARPASDLVDRWHSARKHVARRGSVARLSPTRDSLLLMMSETAVALPVEQRQATEAWAIAYLTEARKRVVAANGWAELNACSRR